MPDVSSIVGFVDFSSSLPLEEIAMRLSNEMFGGIQFSREDTGEWDEIPCVWLERDFLGLRVVLGGNPEEGYTIEVGTTLRAIALESKFTCDISDFLKQQIIKIKGVDLRSETF